MRSIFFIAFLVIGFNGITQPLSGTYTIGGTNPDYPKMGDAVQALDSLGINGPVTFNIRNGTYTDYILFDTIMGTSDTSWVTFQAETGDSSAVVINGYAGSLSLDRVMGFGAGAQYVRVKKLTFMEPDPNQRAITSFDSHHLEFYNCVFTGPSTTVHQQPLVSMGLDSNLVIQNCLFTGSTRDLSIGDIYTRKNIFIRNCDFHGGLEALRLNDLKNVEVTNNNFYGTYTGVGIRRLILIDDMRSMRFINNFIDGSKTAKRGYAIEIRSSAADSSYYLNNIILSSANTSPNSGAILLGNISGGSTFDIFAHNTIRLTSLNPNNSVFQTAACYFDRTLIYNNILVNESGGYIYDNCNYPTDYNLLYTTGAISPQDSSLAQLQQSGMDSNSVFAPPLFDSLLPGLSHAPEIDSAGFPFAVAAKDFVGNFRDPNFPDIGPYEFINPPVVRFPLDTNVCESVVLDAGNPGSSFIWSTGDTTQTILVDSTASYWVTATNSKGSNSDTIQVNIGSLNLPAYQLQSSFDSICTRGCVSLSTNLDSNQYQLMWSDSSGVLGTGNVLNVCPNALPKKYFLQITDGVCVITDSITVFEDLTAPLANTLADTTICYGDSLLLIVNSLDSIEVITWQSEGQNIGSGSIWVKPDSTSTYSAIVDFANGCSDSVSVKVEVHYVDQPIVSLSFDTLSVNDDWNSYQWSINGSSIPLATDTFWVAQQNGNYSIAVTDSFGCSVESTPLLFSSFELDEVSHSELKIYPNPAKELLFIEVDKKLIDPRFELFTVSGEKLALPVIKVSSKKYEVDVKELPVGVYILKVISENSSFVKKFSKS